MITMLVNGILEGNKIFTIYGVSLGCYWESIHHWLRCLCAVNRLKISRAIIPVTISDEIKE